MKSLQQIFSDNKMDSDNIITGRLLSDTWEVYIREYIILC